jgi:cellulose synthase (UDP-forming)
VVTVTLGTVYVGWRWLYSVNWHNWWIGLPLVVAETYALLDSYLFGLTMWRSRPRRNPPAPPRDLTVDVFIATYNEDVELVAATAAAARDIAYPHSTWILDDGDRPDMREAAARLGVGYITRSDDWRDRPRHAKAGNLNNALFHTSGEFLLILDADQIPSPDILDKTLGYFTDDRMALVQTPQWFYNVPAHDPLGSQAPLFFGPIQQGKDGWNAAFFCGTNAIVRRDALMQLGLRRYVSETLHAVERALEVADQVLGKAIRRARRRNPADVPALELVVEAVADARAALAAGEPLAETTYAFQRRVDEASRHLVSRDLEGIQSELEALRDLPFDFDDEIGEVRIDEEALAALSAREWSPIGAIANVRELVGAVNVERAEEAQPIMPLATVSVTEDMATCMRLHALGWRTAYHDEILARGLAPEDLGTAVNQRLRWCQGTMQVFFKENPLLVRGLSVPQRLMYLATMYSYLAGFFAIPLLVAPFVYLVLGVLPVQAFGLTFISFFLPYFLANQVLFLVVGWGRPTWRAQQYNLAMFPVWIKGCVSAFRNVFFGRPLEFVVTPKGRPEERPYPWRLVRWQLVAVTALLVACVVGGLRLWSGATDAYLGTLVNWVWVAYDIVVIGIVFTAARYRPEPPEGLPAVPVHEEAEG